VTATATVGSWDAVVPSFVSRRFGTALVEMVELRVGHCHDSQPSHNVTNYTSK